MALPTISNNNPVAGSISWTAFGITYGGTSYTVDAGNTANKYVYWQYNAGTPALVTTDTLPNNLAPEDLLLFLNKGGVGMLVPEANVVDGSLIVAGSIYADAIAANQINSTHIVSGAVTADEIAAGVVTSSHIAAGAITTEKLSVGSVGNSLVTNGSFEEFANGMPLGWRVIQQGNGGTADVVTGVASSGANALRLTATGNTSNIRVEQTPEKFIPVTSTSSRRWYVSARMGVGTAITNGVYLRANWYDANKVFISSNDWASNIAVGTTWAVYEGQMTPPATARYMGLAVFLYLPNVATNLYVDEIVAREVVISAQIGDGSITTAKLVAGSVTTNILGANAVTADKVLVTDRTNYWETPDFESETVGSQPRGIVANTSCRVISGGAGGSGKALELDARNGSNNDTYGLPIIPVQPGDQFYVRHDWKFLNTAGTASAGVGFRTYGPTKAALGWSSATSTGSDRPTTWQEGANAKTAVWTVPAGVYYVQAWITFANNAETTNRFHLDNILIRKMSGGELIVDGAIVANHLSANSVTSDKILANAVISEKIAANAVTANHIAADAITANKIAAGAIDGKTITGATIIGGEIKTNEIEGNIAARMGAASVWDPFGAKTRAGIGFVVDGSTDNPAGMYSPTGKDLMLCQGGVTNAGSFAYVNIADNGVTLNAWESVIVSGRSGITMLPQNGITTNHGGLTVTGDLTVQSKLTQPIRHVTTTKQTSYPPNNTLWGPGTFTKDTAKSFNDSFLTFPANDRFKFTEAGVYSIHATISNNSTSYTASRAYFKNEAQTMTHIAQAKSEAAIWEFSISLPNYYATADEVMILHYYHSAGATMQWDCILRVTKLQ